MRQGLLELEPTVYESHRFHGSDRCWSESNCYVDIWIEVLHALGLEPAAASAFALSSDFEGDQWRFFKFPPEDLRRLFGIEVHEMNVWRPVAEHVEEQLRFGRLLTMEVDALYLPDTAGTTYRTSHGKTTIVPAMIDRSASRLGYFHGTGYFELSAADFEGIFDPDAMRLPPYVELVRLERLVRDETRVRAVADELYHEHLARRPSENPVTRLGARILDDLDSIRAGGLDEFHAYAFGTCRQCGASAEIGASFLTWRQRELKQNHERAIEALNSIAADARTVEFALSRVAAGRNGDVSASLAKMASAWELAFDELGD
jgi:hypothetical protein